MNRFVYSSTDLYNNGNSAWFEDILQNHHKHLKYLGVAAVTALSFYVLTPSFYRNKDSEMFSGSKRSDKYTTGLINNRNDCFANSSVQALSALPKLTTYLNDLLKQVLFLKTLLDRNETSDDKPITGTQEEGAEREGAGSNGGAPNSERQGPSLEALRPHANLKTVSSTATITTMSTLEESVHGNGKGAGIETAEASADASACHSQAESAHSEESRDGVSSATGNEIPKAPMHEGLAQILFQLQQLVTSSKYVSVWPFLHVLELIFNAKISAGQNDAHELSQVILETLEKENLRLKKFVKDQSLNVIIPDFPVKGCLADHLICLNCQGSSKVNLHPFTMYPLPVPQEHTASLEAMIAGNQTETIEGYGCLSCKIKAILATEEQRKYEGNPDEENNILATLSKIVSEIFINDDLSDDLMNYINNYKKDGCDTSTLKSTIVKKTVVTESPDILILHLSRSVFNGMNYTRNSCYVTFEEELHTQEQEIENNRCVGVKPIKYKLKAMVKHEGTHSQGHYECYKRKPDLVKDAVSGQVVNRSPIIDFGLSSNREATNVWNQAANSNSSDASSISSQDSEPSSPIPFRTVFPEPSAATSNLSPMVNGDDYVMARSDSAASKAPSRRPSKLKKLTGFLSRRSSVASTAPEVAAANGRSQDSRLSVDAGPSGRRSRMNSIVSTGSSTWASSSGADLTEPSASEKEDSTSTVQRKLRKIKSVTKFPFWKVSDAVVQEAQPGEVLAQTKYVYMLYYERVD